MGMLVEKSRQYEQVLAEKHQLSEASGVLQKEYSKLQAQYEAQKARLDALMQNHEE